MVVALYFGNARYPLIAAICEVNFSVKRCRLDQTGKRWQMEQTAYSSARSSIGDICAARCDGGMHAARHTAAVTHAAAARTATLSGGT